MDGQWLEPPEGRAVVLHTRAVTGVGGGPDKTILLSASFLSETPYWVAAAYLHPPGDPGLDLLRARASAAECPLISVPDRGPLDVTVLVRLLGICRHLGVRIWHGHDYKSNLLGLLLRPFHRMQLVTTVHGWVYESRRTPLYYAIDRRCLPHYQHVIAVSEDLADHVRRLGVPAERCTALHNAIDEQVFSRQTKPVRPSLRDELGVPADRLVIGAVGRLSPEKAFDDLIEATAVLLSRNLDLELWIVGDGECRIELQELVKKRGLQDRVKLLGYRHDMIELYWEMDLFVLSSLREGLPNVLLEAMAMEVPVVSTDVGGIPELVQDGLTGLLCPAGDSVALSQVMEQALTDLRLRRRLAQAGRERVEARHSFSQRMAKVQTIYDRVLEL